MNNSDALHGIPVPFFIQCKKGFCRTHEHAALVRKLNIDHHL